MTTTAFYRQLTEEPQPMDALRTQTERAEAAEAELLAVRDDNHSMMLEIHNLRIERDALVAELAKLRKQKPVAFWWTGLDGEPYGGPYRGTPSDAAIDNARRAGCGPQLLFAVPSPVPAVAAPSVPDVLIQLRDKVTRIPHRTEYLSGQQFAYVRLCEVVGEIDALLQSSQAALAVPNLVESHQIKAPDCRTCANRGRVNGLSQESYCDSCVYQGRDCRQNHFVDASKMVDAVKRRCEACAILPCSCK